jgi:hypothetical protein
VRKKTVELPTLIWRIGQKPSTQINGSVATIEKLNVFGLVRHEIVWVLNGCIHNLVDYNRVARRARKQAGACRVVRGVFIAGDSEREDKINGFRGARRVGETYA